MQQRFGVRSPERLAAVRTSHLLEIGPEEAFDRIVRLASTILGTSMVALTVVDDVRTFVKGQPAPGVFCPPGGTFGLPVDETGCHVVVDSGDEVCVPDVRQDDRFRDLAQIHAFGVRSWLGTPIVDVEGFVLGNLCAMDTVVRDWSDEERESLHTLARAAGGEIALRAALRESERHAADAARLAETLEQSLVPGATPRHQGVDIGATFRAGGSGVTVMGDFYDVIPRDDDFGVVVGDVSGHGPEAARATAMARSAVRTAGYLEPDPVAVLHTVDAVLGTWFDGASSFVTAVYALVRPAETGWSVEVASGGHPPGFVVRADGAVEALGGGGTVLGLLPTATIGREELTLLAGDALVLYTDGVTEARAALRTVQFEESGVAAVLAGLPPGADADLIAHAVAEAAIAHAGGLVRDDAGVLVVRIPPVRTPCSPTRSRGPAR